MTREENKMTREENIVRELNLAEQRLKKAILNHDDEGKEKQINYINGMVRMLVMLGYKLLQSKIENVEGYWIEEYSSIKDTR
jgi:hypothetical protein